MAIKSTNPATGDGGAAGITSSWNASCTNSRNVTAQQDAPGRKLIDLTGMKFGRWTVLALHPKRTRLRRAIFLCRCDCGSEHLVQGASLRGGWSQSCGCVAQELKTKHGQAKGNRTRVYVCWANMRQRCSNPNNIGYSNYGGRGITVCERWQTFENFLADMGHPPRGKSLDRIDVNGNYEPSNCRWATSFEQARNKRPLSFSNEYLAEGGS